MCILKLYYTKNIHFREFELQRTAKYSSTFLLFVYRNVNYKLVGSNHFNLKHQLNYPQKSLGTTKLATSGANDFAQIVQAQKY